MLRFAANIGRLFAEYPFMTRFERAATAGFTGVEYPEPYGYDIRAIRAALTSNGLQQVQFNLPRGNRAAGEQGVTNDPRRRVQFRENLDRALDVAAMLQCPRMICAVGVEFPDVSLDTQWATVVENLRHAAERAASAGVHILIEPLNHFDVPGYLVTTMPRALRLLDEVDHENLRLLCDIYHLQRMEGNLTNSILANLDRIEHFEIADVPGRHQPGTGEINYRFLLNAIDEAGFAGWICPEYDPLGSTEDSLRWLRDWGYWS